LDYRLSQQISRHTIVAESSSEKVPETEKSFQEPLVTHIFGGEADSSVSFAVVARSLPMPKDDVPYLAPLKNCSLPRYLILGSLRQVGHYVVME
jgi:hypothetical protein